MDSRVLKSLAHTALKPYLTPGSGGQTDIDEPNDYPGDVASQIAGTGVRNHEFCAGFNMAMEIAALVTQNPAQVPAIDDIIEKARAEVLNDDRREAA
ncbi:MAG TPA: hypothetical protein VGI19_14590 [Candidatus Cybelea sp.]|jgi:hypothetical protein